MANVAIDFSVNEKEAVAGLGRVEAAEKKVAGEAVKLAGDLDKVATAEKKTAGTTRELASETEKVVTAKKKHRQSSRELAEELGLLGKAQRSLTNDMKDFAKGIAAGFGIQKLANLFTTAIQTSREFRKEVAGVSLAMTDTKGLEAQTREIRKYALEFGNSAKDQARGLADITGAGFEGARALDVLRQSNMLAAGGMTEVSVAADGLTSVMNAYGNGIRDATDASDTLFVGLRVGKTTIADMSSQLGQVAPIAANVGVSFQELVGGIAAVTTGGVSTNIAVTQMRSVLSSVLKPSQEAKELAKKLGIEFDTQGLKAKGLAGFLKDVVEKTKGNKDQMAALFGNVESLGTVFALTGNQADTFADALKQMEKRSGETDKAFAKVGSTADIAFKRVGTAFEDVMISLGDTINQTLAPAANSLADNMKKIADALGVSLKILVAYLAIFVVLPAAYAMAEKALWRLVAANTANNMSMKDSFKQTVSLKQAAGLLFAAWAGWEIGTYLRDNFIEARIFGNLLVEALLVGWERIKQGAMLLFAWLKFGFMVVVEFIKSQMVSVSETMARFADSLPNDMGKDMAESLRTFNLVITPTIDATTKLKMEVADANNTFAMNRAVINKNIQEMNDWEYANEAAHDAAKKHGDTVKKMGDDMDGERKKRELSNEEMEKWKTTLKDVDQILRQQARMLGDDMVDAGLDYVDAMVAIYEKEQALIALHKLDANAQNAIETARTQALQIFEKQTKAIRERLTPAQQEIKAMDTEIKLMRLSSDARAVEESVIRAVTAAKADGKAMSDEAIETLRVELTERQKMISETEKMQNLVSKWADVDTFDKLVSDIGKVEKALDKAIGEGAVEKVALLKNALGNMRHAMVTGIVDSSQQALRSMQSMTKDGSRAFQAFQIAIDALSVVQAISAVLNQGQGDPYTAFARMAAMAAAVASLGVSIGNFAASGYKDTAKERQAQQGTGSVLGDAEAKSASIANATEITAKATSELVSLNRGMLRALQQFNQALGAAAVSLARGAGEADFTGTTTVASSSFLNGMRTLHDSAGLFDFAGIFKSRSKITDRGIVIFGGALNDLLQNIAVGAYQEVQSRSWLFGGRHTSTGIVPVADEFAKQFQLVIESIAETVRQGALALGMLPADVEAALAAFKVEEIKISLKGLTPEEQQKELEAVFSKLFDDLAGSVVPFIEQFQQVGEGLGETLVRVATEVQVMEHIFTQLGIAVDKTDPEKFAQLADGIVQAAGGLEEAQAMWANFAQAFFTPQELGLTQVATNSAARDTELDRLGLKPMTKEEFKAAFLAAMPTLTPEEIVDWLHVGELIASVEDSLKSLWDQYYEAFYSASENADRNLQELNERRAAALDNIGLDEDTTAAQFRAAFEAALPNLNDEQIAEWLLAGQAISNAADAQAEYNDALAQDAAAATRAQTDYLEIVRAVADELAGIGASSKFRSAIVNIRKWEAETIASMNAAARAAGLQGASERDLAMVHQVAAQRVKQATKELMAQIAELMKLLEYGSPFGDYFADQEERQLSQIQNVADANDDLYDRQMAGIKGIQDYLDSMLFGDLSALTPEQQLAEALRQLEETQAAALGGDAEAMAQLPQMADAYLRLLRGAEASGADYNQGFNYVRQLLQAVANAGPTVGPGGGTDGGGYGPGDFGSVLRERDARTAEQEAAYRADLARQLADHLRDLAGALGEPVFELMRSLGVDIHKLAADLGINLSTITGESVEALADMASLLGVSLSSLTHELGLELTDLGDGLRELTEGLGINFDELTGTQLRSLTDLAASLGLSLTEITTAMGLNLTDLSEGVLDLTNQLGIDLTNLTVSSTQQLADLAASLGVDLGELATSVGINLGDLTDAQSLLNQALADTIDDLPAAQRDQLRPLLEAITNATSEADANAAIANLEAATNGLPPEFRNLLAPYLTGVFPATAMDQLDYLSGIYSYSEQMNNGLGSIADILTRMAQGQNIPGFAVGTDYVPHDMIANIHKGEMIIDAATAEKLRSKYGFAMPVLNRYPQESAANDSETATEVRALRKELAELRAQLAMSATAGREAMQREHANDRANDTSNTNRLADAMSGGRGSNRGY